MESWQFHTSKRKNDHNVGINITNQEQGYWDQSQRPLFSFSSDVLFWGFGARTADSLFANTYDLPAFLSLNGLSLFDATDLIALGNFRGISTSLVLLSLFLMSSNFCVASALSGWEDGGGLETSRMVDFRHFFLRFGFGAFALACNLQILISEEVSYIGQSKDWYL